MTIHAEPLPNEALDPIPLGRPPYLLGDDEPESTLRLDPLCPRDEEVSRAKHPRSAPMLSVLPRGADAKDRRKPVICGLSQELLRRDDGDEALATLQAAASDDTSAGLGGHARAKPVGPFARDVAGLKGALHGEVSPTGHPRVHVTGRVEKGAQKYGRRPHLSSEKSRSPQNPTFDRHRPHEIRVFPRIFDRTDPRITHGAGSVIKHFQHLRMPRWHVFPLHAASLINRW